MKARLLYSNEFNGVLNSLTTSKFPVRVAYKVATLKNELMKEFEKVDKLRIDIIKKYYKTDSDGNPVKGEDGNVIIENTPDLLTEIRELDELVIPVTIKFTMEELSTVEFTGDEILALMQAELVE